MSTPHYITEGKKRKSKNKKKKKKKIKIAISDPVTSTPSHRIICTSKCPRQGTERERGEVEPCEPGSMRMSITMIASTDL